MRRLIAIVLFAAFVLPFALPLFALGQQADAGVPACCRRNGRHHCAMNASERMLLASNGDDASQRERWQPPMVRCPYCPASAISYHSHLFTTQPAEITLAAFFTDPVRTAQTQCRWRMARDRSRQKRGPPLVSLA